MRKDRELDEILESIKSRPAENENFRTDEKPMLQPSVQIENDDELVWVDNNDIKEKLNASKEEAPKTLIDIPAPEKAPVQSNFAVQDADDKQDDTSDTEPQSNTVSNKTFVKIVAITVAVMVAIAGVVMAVIHFTKDDSTAAQVEKYDYSTDILKEYEDVYSKTNQIAGSIAISDLKVDKYFTIGEHLNYPYLYNGADIALNQQILSIDVTSLNIDLESLYSTSEAYTQTSQLIEFNTLFEKGTYKVVAAYYTNKLPYDNNNYVFPYSLCGTMTTSAFTTYRSKITSRQLYDTGIDILYTDKLLSVCVDSDTVGENYKFVLLCVKTDNESKTTTVIDNDNIYYPQSYYDNKGTDNPFKYAIGWYPDMIVDQSTGQTQKVEMADVIEKAN